MKEEHWREWHDTELPQISMVIQSYDTAFEEDEEADFSARTTWGVFEHEEYLDPKLPMDSEVQRTEATQHHLARAHEPAHGVPGTP